MRRGELRWPPRFRRHPRLRRTCPAAPAVRADAASPARTRESRLDITIAEGDIAQRCDAGAPTTLPRVDLDGGLVLPCFVDIHTHLDKGHIWPRKPNPDGTWLGALNAR